MSRNVYHEINLHIVWRTKNSVPVLIGEVETHCHRYIKRRAIETAGVIVHEIGGMPDHVHLAASVPPTLLISEWIGRLKGSSAHFINHDICNVDTLHWQDGYGVVSFGSKDLAWVVRYIQNQKRHHAGGEVFERLERIEQAEKTG